MSRTVTLGNFDGFHLGHRQVVETARSEGGSVRPVCFEPVARQYFSNENWRRRLTTVLERSRLLAGMGLEDALQIPFDKETVNKEPGEFLEELRSGLDFTRIVVGYDFHFGSGRSGTVEFLRRWCTSRGLDTIIVPPLNIGDGPVKSERIRSLLEEGDVIGAENLLGRPYSLTGVVARGKGFGRKLGFPTLNVRVPDCKLLPLPGSYCGYVYSGMSGERMPAGIFVPSGKRGPVEACIPDRQLNECYGQLLTVQLAERIRGVVETKTENELKELIADDMEVVRQLGK